MMIPTQFKSISRSGREILRLRPAWLSYWGSILAAAGVIGLWVLKRPFFDALSDGVGLPQELAGLGLGLGLLPIFARVLYHRYTHAYEIEDRKKLRMVAGFVSRVKREFPLTDKVQTDMGQSIIGRVLNYGTLAFWTGDDRSRLQWKDAPDPDRIIAFLDQLKSGAFVSSSTGSATRSDQRASPSEAHSISVGIGAPTLKEAKSTNYTHFGTGANDKPLSEMVAKRIRTPLGNYIDNDDGTVTDETGGLMWQRAPWGMVWTGNGFVGDPIKLRWGDAVRLFGQGVDVGYRVGATMAYMGHEKRAASAFEHGYKEGKCLIRAGSYNDWRLPTAQELDRFSPYLHSNYSDQGRTGDGLSQDEQYDWRWHGPAGRAAFQRLYPELFSLKAHLWTATGLGSGLAWAYDGNLPVGDFKVSDERPVIFVRKLTGSEIRAAKTEDETLKLEQTT
ncbi:MAG: hypothetical protein CMI15_00010 [Opitutaceae bacterium]|nr:hypothetical protein [Opitutaceae bacterium]|tara:strand:+ start:9706 stop:11046 length:1341 start_codon:yes stop_codon:yes gene_type:complete